LRESLYKIVEPPVRLYGAYFAATGRSTTEQGFIRGVLDKLPESQSEVAWTPQYVQTQGRSRLLASLLFAGTVLIAVGIVWAGIEFNKNR
jgi:predicted acyltransferase